MRPTPLRYSLALVLTLITTAALAQSSGPSTDRLIRMNGALPVTTGTQVGTTELVEFSIYDQETGGTLLWQETQALSIDGSGGYSVFLGAMTDGLPVELFAGGAARWLSVQRAGGPAAARSLLTAVPYAVSAANADTLGGRPAGDYLLTPAARRSDSTKRADGSAAGANDDPVPLVNNGTANFIGKFFNNVDLINSSLYDAGGLVGLNTTTPFDVFHSRFTNAGGTQTGIAVQNLSGGATAYSGMLFYDHTGALRQFQGYRNTTGEYRINNISPTGSINFMIGSDSKFLVATSGDIEAGTALNPPGFRGNFTVTASGNGIQGVAVFDRVPDDGTLVRFRRNSTTVGTIDVAAGVVSYNAFTGSHFARTDEVIERGMLVSLTGDNGRLEDNPGSEILYGVKKSQRANDPAIMGAYLARQHAASANLSESVNPHLVEAVGNGEMWVIDTGRNVAAGAYLLSSDVAGHAMADPGTFDVSYIIARLAEPIDWTTVTASVQGADGRPHKRVLASVFFENFVVDRTRSAEIELLTERIAALEAALKALTTTTVQR